MYCQTISYLNKKKTTLNRDRKHGNITAWQVLDKPFKLFGMQFDWFNVIRQMFIRNKTYRIAG